MTTGCGAAPFPGSPAASGVRDVPFVDTYNFDFPTGSANHGSKDGRDTSGNLRVFSAADLANLLSAANVSTELSGGVISGYTLFGTAVERVILQARDFDGNVLPDVFYNGLGGVPDFGAEEGTTSQGTFTIFNVPPGETFLIASHGGIGMGRVSAFARGISVKAVDVVPLVVAQIGVTGAIADWTTGLNVFPVTITGMGLQSDSRFSDDQGHLDVTPLVGYRFVLPAGSEFLIQQQAAGYLPTYQMVNTYLTDLNGAVDLTRDFFMVSQSTVTRWLAQAGINRIPGTGMIAGRVMSGDSSQPHGRLAFYTFDGTPVGEYRMGLSVLANPGTPSAEDLVYFVAFNLPPGPVFTRASAYHVSSGFEVMMAGGSVTEVLADSVTLEDIKLAGSQSADTPGGTTEVTLRGTITLSDLATVVKDVVVDVGGYPGGPGRYDGPVRSRTVFTGDEYSVLAQQRVSPTDPYDLTQSNLPIKGDYVVRVANLPGQSHYVDTYQYIDTRTAQPLPDGSAELVWNLQVFSRTEVEAMAAVAGVQLDPGRGVLVGRVIDVLSGNTAQNIRLTVYNQDGIPVGDMRYLDLVGLPQRLDSTSLQGEFMVFNVPPGLVLIQVTSANDTGSLTTRVYPGGVTAVGVLPVGDAPEEITSISGTLFDLKGKAPVAGAEVMYRGEPSRDPSVRSGYLTGLTDTLGNFSAKLRIFGDFIVSATPGSGYFRTHNLGVQTGLREQTRENLWALSRQHVQQMEQQLAAAGKSVVQDAARGIVVGEVQARSWLNRPGDSWTIQSGVLGPTAIASSLMNGDYIPDMLVANGDSDDVSVFFGNQEGTFDFAGSYPVGLSPIDLLGMDVNADGVGDILVLDQGALSGDVRVLMGTIRGSFREERSRRLFTGNAPVAMSLGDMDGDGLADDLVVLNGGGTPSLSVYFRNDERRFVEAPYSPTPIAGNGPSALQVLDIHPVVSDAGRLRGSKVLDDVIVAMEGSDTIESYANIGTELYRETPVFLASGTLPSDVLRIDINFDGVLDTDRSLEFVVLSRGLNEVQVLHQDAAGLVTQLAPPVQLDAGCNARKLKLTPVNEDGWADLLVLCNGTGTAAVYLGKRQGQFIPWQCASGCRRPALTVGSGPSDIVVSNFDSRQGADLVVANRLSHSLSVFSSVTTPLQGVPVTVADLDGNPVPDLYYLDDFGNILPTDTMTSSSGRFVAFNVPPGSAWVVARDGDNGDRRLVVLPGEATYSTLLTIAGSPPPIVLEGTVSDAVGAAQEGIELQFSGTGISVISANDVSANGGYSVTLPTNFGETVVRLRQP
ncbi:MAG: VCBS repeat-containing protein [Nitrospirota bacterium]|nr:VCBS repeat-containing protein [Nitrospirota bacterium]